MTDGGTHAAAVPAGEGTGAECYCGPEGLVEMVRRDDIDIVVAAIVGAAGLPAVLAAVEAGKTLALANKEALVVAGSLLIPQARKKRCADPAGGFRALGRLPGDAVRPAERGPAGDPDGQRRAVPQRHAASRSRRRRWTMP